LPALSAPFHRLFLEYPPLYSGSWLRANLGPVHHGKLLRGKPPEMSAVPVKDLTLVNQKRVEVARALATKPELLLLDELMAGLTPAEVSEAMELVTRIRDKGITILMVEHVMKAIMGISARVMVLHHGEKIAEGTCSEISSNKTVIDIYLGKETNAGS
jgi:ABC-type branched-subunit amino acid transport system ATPase component